MQYVLIITGVNVGLRDVRLTRAETNLFLAL